MRLGNWICAGGYELSNIARVTKYGAGLLFDDGCACPALGDDYVSPADDPAPWYDANHPESADFFGFLAETIDLSVAASRKSDDSLAIGSVLGAESLPGRVVEVQGWMCATDSHSMYWGERWLTEAARATYCASGCRGDDLSLLAYCRDDGDDSDFRTLVGSALVAGPNFSELAADGCFLIGRAQLQFQSSMPYLYGPEAKVVDAQTVLAGATDCVLITTDEWFQGDALIIALQAGSDPVSDLTITITMSLDGTCPETRVPASITYDVGSLVASSGLVIDGARREVGYANPTAKRTEPGFPHIDWGSGAFCWPVVPPCASVCVCLDNGGATDVQWSVSSFTREL